MKALCADAETQCLLETDFAAGHPSLLVIRFTGSIIEQYSASQIDAAVWARLQATQSGTLLSQQILSIDGYSVVQRIFTVPSAQGGNQVQMLIFIKGQNGAILRLEAEAGDRDSFTQHGPEIDWTIANLRIAAMTNSPTPPSAG